MSHGDKYKYSNTQKRQADYIKESFKEKGLTNEAAEQIAWATLNKESRKRKIEQLMLQEEENLGSEFRFFLERNGS